MAVLAGLTVADDPEVWSSLGFDVAAGLCRVGTVEVALGAQGSGVRSWSLAAVDGPSDGGTSEVDGLATSLAEPASPGCPPGLHDNGVTRVDHLVVATPDLERTVSALGGLGITERRRRDAGRPGGAPATQVFFRLGEVILELVGPPDPAGDGPARFWGLAFQVSDLGATAAYLGSRLRPLKAAVQPGRFIATLDRDARSTVDMAFMD
jgi:hypothetical protein